MSESLTYQRQAAPTRDQIHTLFAQTMGYVAATGQTITHLDLDRDACIAGAIANGVPAEYEVVLRPLTETVESGNGSNPNGMVEQITGTPPRTFRDFARKNAAAWSEAAT